MRDEMPDNYDYFKKNEDRLEEALEQRPTCDCCGEYIQDDFYYEINNETYCEECMQESFRKVI